VERGRVEPAVSLGGRRAALAEFGDMLRRGSVVVGHEQPPKSYLNVRRNGSGIKSRARDGPSTALRPIYNPDTPRPDGARKRSSCPMSTDMSYPSPRRT